eukprot:366125-Chlamydomonas_euryale.AAC.8
MCAVVGVLGGRGAEHVCGRGKEPSAGVGTQHVSGWERGLQTVIKVDMHDPSNTLDDRYCDPDVPDTPHLHTPCLPTRPAHPGDVCVVRDCVVDDRICYLDAGGQRTALNPIDGAAASQREVGRAAAPAGPGVGALERGERRRKGGNGGEKGGTEEKRGGKEKRGGQRGNAAS